MVKEILYQTKLRLPVRNSVILRMEMMEINIAKKSAMYAEILLLMCSDIFFAENIFYKATKRLL